MICIESLLAKTTKSVQPRLLSNGFACWLEARVIDVVAHGDHSVFTAEVVNVGAQDVKAMPLVCCTR